MTDHQTHAFNLYRSGPWPENGSVFRPDDNQLWAQSYPVHLHPDSVETITLRPMFGSAASLYRIELTPQESPENNWRAFTCLLILDNQDMGVLPLSWYVGAPADWPSGLARYPEIHGPQLRGMPYGVAGPRGVWTLAARRHS